MASTENTLSLKLVKRVVEGVNHQLLRKEKLKQEEESRHKQGQRAKLLLGNELRLQEQKTKLQTEPPSQGASSEVKQTKKVLLHVVHVLYMCCTHAVQTCTYDTNKTVWKHYVT